MVGSALFTLITSLWRPSPCLLACVIAGCSAYIICSASILVLFTCQAQCTAWDAVDTQKLTTLRFRSRIVFAAFDFSSCWPSQVITSLRPCADGMSAQGLLDICRGRYASGPRRTRIIHGGNYWSVFGMGKWSFMFCAAGGGVPREGLTGTTHLPVSMNDVISAALRNSGDDGSGPCTRQCHNKDLGRTLQCLLGIHLSCQSAHFELAMRSSFSCDLHCTGTSSSSSFLSPSLNPVCDGAAVVKDSQQLPTVSGTCTRPIRGNLIHFIAHQE